MKSSAARNLPGRARARVTTACVLAWVLIAASTADAAWKPGLKAGTLSGSWSTTAPNPGATNFLGPHAGKTNGSPPWTNDITWVYSGQVYFNGGTYCFAENIDDNAMLVIDGIMYLYDRSWNTPTTSGQIVKPAGWYDIEIRFGNGGGGAGAVAGSGWTTNMGFGYNTNGLAGTNGTDYVFPEDDGSKSLFRYNDGTYCVSSAPASSVLTNSGVMNGALTDSNNTYDVVLYFGPTDGGTVASAWSNSVYMGRFTNTFANLSYPATGLVGAASCYYRFRATNTYDDEWAPSSESFTTQFDPLLYGSRMKITFSGYGRPEILTNFPALVIFSASITNFSYSTFTDPQSGGDLRFTASDGTTLLCHEIEKWDSNGQSFVWVQVPELTATTCVWACWSGNGTSAPSYTTNGGAWSPAFKGVWHLNSGESQSRFPDSTSNKRSGLNVEATPFAGKVAGAQNFDGVNARVMIGTVGVGGGQPKTLSGWAKSDKTSGYATWTGVFGCQDGANDRYFDVQIDDGNNYCLHVYGYDYNYCALDTSWHYFAATYTGGIVAIYLDGFQVGGPNVRTLDTGDAKFTIGERLSNTNNFDGLIDEVRIENTARSADWIWACWMNQAWNNLFCAYGPAGGLVVDNDGWPSNITAGSATLNGRLLSTGSAPAEVWMYWGPTDGGVNAGSWSNVYYFGTNTQSCPVSYSRSVSVPSNAYCHYRYRAADTGTTAWAKSTASFISGPVTIQATDANASEEGADTGTFTLYRPARATNGATTVNYAIAGAAVGGSDYQALSGTAVIPAGATSAVITVVPIYDSAPGESDETVVVTLTSGAYAIGAPSNATVTIAGDAAAANWKYRMKIFFDGYDKAESLTNFPALVVFGANIPGFSYGQFASANGDDLRFANSNRTTWLNYEIEEWDPGGSSYVWVQAPQLSAGTYVWAYWGMPGAAAPPCTTNGATWDPTFLGVWHLHATDPLGLHLDSTAGKRHGMSIGTSSAAGKIGNARFWEGNDMITLPEEPFATILTRVTISAWTYGTETSMPQNCMLFEGRSSVGREFNVHLPWGDTNIMWDAFGNYDRISKPAATSEYEGQWNHWVFQRDDNFMTMYLNGATWLTGQGKTKMYTPVDSFRLGADAGGGNNYDGTIDEFRVSNTARSSNWVWACWMNQASNSVFCRYDTILRREGTVILMR